MANQELLSRQSNLPIKGVRVMHRLRVVTDLQSEREVDISEAAVHLGHKGNIPNMHDITAEGLRVISGRPVITYTSSKVVDMEEWRKKGMVGEYHKGQNTFAYTEIVDEKGRERVETVAFTSQTQQQVRENLGEPDQSKEDTNSGVLVEFPVTQELRPTG